MLVTQRASNSQHNDHKADVLSQLTPCPEVCGVIHSSMIYTPFRIDCVSCKQNPLKSKS